MKNLKSWQTFNENYPPGAEHDSRAPWNQRDPDFQEAKFDDVLYSAENDEVPVHVEYTYYETPHGITKYITDYSYKILGDESLLDKEYIEEDIRTIIGNHAEKHEFV
jgi:hypothetical protein